MLSRPPAPSTPESTPEAADDKSDGGSEGTEPWSAEEGAQLAQLLAARRRARTLGAAGPAADHVGAGAPEIVAGHNRPADRADSLKRQRDSSTASQE